jgi:elongation factor G
MPDYTTADIRNIALVGHGGAGKTSLAEHMLHTAGVTSRLGNVTDGTSHLDFTEEEHERKCSLDSALASLKHDGKLINLVDTPGAPDFIGPALASLAAVETAICVVSAPAGIEVNTRRMMEKAKQYGLGRMIVVNKIDADNVELPALVNALKETFGQECVCMNLPAGGGTAVIDCFGQAKGEPDFDDLDEAHTRLVEAIVESDEALMEEYLENGSVAPEKLQATVFSAVASGSVVPIVFTSTIKGVGIKELLGYIAGCLPSPIDGLRRKLVHEDAEDPLDPEPDGPFVGQVFKSMGDPKSNIRYSAVRVLRGSLSSDLALRTADKKGLRPGQLHKMLGAEQQEIDRGIPGDIITLAKLDLRVGSVLFDKTPGEIPMPQFPSPMFSVALEPKSRADGDKVSAALHRFTDEDPCLKSERDPGTNELVVRGMGDLHLRTLLHRMERYFKLSVDTKPPKIPYRETITASAKDIEYTHKKQTGGAGQFARVFIGMEPMERGGGYEFVDEIFGGSIDQQFRPSVDKGIRAQMAEGVLAGYPVVDVRVRLTDGKTHPVDSKDIAFQIAGREVFKIAFMKCKPCLLEPIINLEATIPSDKMGDITGDLASRRGRPVGQDMLPGGMAVVRGQVPLAEMSDYNSRLSSMTGGQGSYTMELSHYEVVPANVQQQIIAASKKAKEDAQAGH